MRTIVIAFVLAFAAGALAQEVQLDNPKLFVQPEEPPLPALPPAPAPLPPARAEPQQQQQQQPVEEQPAEERQNVVGRDENTDQQQHLYDQWNAPGQGRGGSATVTPR